jgi:hypothetical protein
MKAVTFKNTNIKVSTWPPDLHLTHSQGYAYALPTHFTYLCGENCPYVGWSLVEENVTAGIRDWCQNNFGATDFKLTEYDVGTAIHSVWRPGLFSANDLRVALAFTDEDLSRASQALRLLVSRLDEIFLFIEPDTKHLEAYGHKTRDLLIAACTEVENYFQHYMQLASATPMRGQYFTVKDYARLQSKLFLDEFDIDMYAYRAIGTFAPFRNWTSSNFVLPWYDAYNKTKHHRDSEFARATLINCIQAVGACLVLFSVRFGPIWWQSNFINSPIPDAYRIFRQPLYKGDPCKVYIPKIEFPKGVTGRSWGNHSSVVAAWHTIPFSL